MRRNLAAEPVTASFVADVSFDHGSAADRLRLCPGVVGLDFWNRRRIQEKRRQNRPGVDGDGPKNRLILPQRGEAEGTSRRDADDTGEASRPGNRLVALR